MTEERLMEAIRSATSAMEMATMLYRLRFATNDLREAIERRRLERRYNPDWRLQPRLPRGNPSGANGRMAANRRRVRARTTAARELLLPRMSARR